MLKKTALDELIDLGIDEDELLKDYEMVHSAEVDYDLEEELDFVITEINKTSKKKVCKYRKCKTI